MSVSNVDPPPLVSGRMGKFSPIARLRRLYRRLPLSVRNPVRKWINDRIERPGGLRWLYLHTIVRDEYLRGHLIGSSIELTDKCNLKCVYCPKSLDIGIKGGFIDFDLFKKAADILIEEDYTAQIALVGFGEPFLYPHLLEAVRYIKQRAPHKVIVLTSNGTLLNAEWGENLANLGLDKINISVNATSRDQYRRINASDGYEKVVANTRAFLNAVNKTESNMRVYIQLLSKINDESQIERFKLEWEPYLGRCGEFQVHPFTNWAGQIDTVDILEREQRARRGEDVSPHADKSLLRQLKDRKRDDIESVFHYDSRAKREEEPYPCYFVGRTRVISREGDALVCCMVFPEEQGDLELGKILDSGAGNPYNSERIKELHKLNMDGRLGEVRPCSTCNTYKNIPNIWFKNPFHRFGIGQKWY